MAQTYIRAGTVARILGVSPKTVARWAKDGKLPCTKTLGGHRRFDRDLILDLREHLNHEVEA